MNIKKILNFYLVLILTLTMGSALSYSDSVKYYASVFSSGVWGILGDIENSGGYKNVSPLNTSVTYADLSTRNGSNFYSQNNNSAVLNFDIVNNPEKSFAKPGANGVNIMSFIFKPQDQDFRLKNLTLKIAGASPDSIKSAQLTSDETVLSTGDEVDEYLHFKNIDYRLTAGTEGVLNVVLYLNENSKVGDRLRLDIETPDDIEIEVSESPYKINGYYPIKGKYLSIVQSR
jgi:hypothetical protein